MTYRSAARSRPISYRMCYPTRRIRDQSFFQPAREVAGFYDAFVIDDNQIAFVIADVCDKGVGAALFMALTRSLIRAFWLDE